MAAPPALAALPIENVLVGDGVGGAIPLAISGPRTSGLADGLTAYPAVQNILLTARALGLGAVRSSSWIGRRRFLV